MEKERDFHSLAEPIDRVFRFFEMLGITALLATIFGRAIPNGVEAISYTGSALAFIYLTEPVVDAVASKALGPRDKRSWTRVGMALAVIAVGIYLAAFAAPFIAKVSLAISKTISVNS